MVVRTRAMSGGNAVSEEEDKAAGGKGMGAMGILVSGQGATKHHASCTCMPPFRCPSVELPSS